MEWLVPLNETNVYGRDERGLSSARARQVLGPMSELTKGANGGVQDKLRFGNSVELRARLLLYRRPYIQRKTNTRIRATSATNAANCRTCQLDKSLVLVHCPVHCIASPPSEVPSGRVHQSQGSQNGHPLSTLPYPYSEHAYCFLRVRA